MEVRCQRRVAGVAAAVRDILRTPERPTGIYVPHPGLCVTLLTCLLRSGVAVPDSVSILCQDDESDLGLLCPVPSRYQRSAKAFASKLADLVRRVARSRACAGKAHLIMPTMIAGETLGPVPKRNR